jgi:hypothetical protein
MADTILEIQLPEGLTGLTVYLYDLDDDTTEQNTGGDTLTAETNATQFYRATISESLVGDYRVHVETSSGLGIYSGYVTLADDTGTHRSRDDYQVSGIIEQNRTRATAFTASGLTVYALVYDEDNNIYNGSTFVAYSAGDYATYAQSAAEVTGTGRYSLALPNAAYTVEFRKQAGASPVANNDARLPQGAQV